MSFERDPETFGTPETVALCVILFIMLPALVIAGLFLLPLRLLEDAIKGE